MNVEFRELGLEGKGVFFCVCSQQLSEKQKIILHLCRSYFMLDRALNVW